MSQLESLLSIARLQADQQLSDLQKQKQVIAYLNQQLIELTDYSRMYQQSAVGTDDNLSSLLIHRQHFISQLSKQIEELKDRICALDEDAAECTAQWQYLEARKKAVESMHERKKSEDNKEKATAAQLSIDEQLRSKRTHKLDREEDLGLPHA